MNKNVNDNCTECGNDAKYSAWRNADGTKVCPKCVSDEDWNKTISAIFPFGIPENLE